MIFLNLKELIFMYVWNNVSIDEYNLQLQLMNL